MEVETPKSEEPKVDVEIVDTPAVEEEKVEEKKKESEEVLVFGVARTPTVNIEVKTRGKRSKSPFTITTRRTRSTSKSSTVTPIEEPIVSVLENVEKDVVTEVTVEEVKEVTLNDEMKENVISEVVTPISITVESQVTTLPVESQEIPSEESIVSALKQKEDSVPHLELPKSASSTHVRTSLKGPTDRTWNSAMMIIRTIYVIALVCGVAYYFAMPQHSVEEGGSE